MKIEKPTSPQFLSSVLMALPESAYWKDRNGVYLGCNHTMLKMAGLNSLEEIIGKTDHDMPWKDIADEIYHNDQQVIQTGTEHVFQEAGATIDGTFLVVRSKKSPLHNAQGETIGVIGVSTDITSLILDQKRQHKKAMATEDTFKKHAEYLSAFYYELTGQKLPATNTTNDIVLQIRSFLHNIISLMPGNIFWKSKQGFYLGCNNHVLKLLKLNSQEELIGKTSYDLMEKSMADAINAVDNQVMANGENLVLEEIGYNAHGGYSTYLSHKSPWRDLNGEVIGLVGLSLDITEQKEMAKALTEAKEAAESAMLAKNQFLGNMRHDIRTPLTCIVGVARILQSQEVVPEKKQLIDGLVNASSTLLELLTKMLEYADIGSGERPLTYEKFDLKAIIENTMQLFFTGEKNSAVVLQWNIDDTIPTELIGDSFRTQRILLNLLSNAIKFTHSGSITVKAKLVNKKAKKAQIELSVMDTGIGIAPEQHEFVFGKFNTLHNADTGRYKGEGLGLAIVRQFAEDLNGKIFLESEVGKGSTFTCSLPFEYVR